MSEATTAAPTDEALEAARWNLEPLVEDGGPDRALEQLDRAQEQATAFAERYRGKLPELGAAELAEAMRELESISDLAGRAGTYASLAFAVDTLSPEVGSLMQQVRERAAALQTTLLFFDLEWNELPDERADELLADEQLAFCRHYLETERRYRPHQLSEPEELILTETSVTGPGAFSRLFTEQISAVTVELADADEPLELMDALSRLQDPDRERRAAAAGAVTEALEPGLRTRAFIYNTLLQDKATKDRLRSFDNWLAARNLDNEASDESVQALIEAVEGRYELARRWYRLKARMLGLRHRVAAEGRAVRSLGPAVHQRLRCHEAAEGHARGHPLGEQQDVRVDAVGLGRERPARVADAGLDLVEHEQDAAVVAAVAQPLEPFDRRRDVAALAEHGLDDHGGHVVGRGGRGHHPVELGQRSRGRRARVVAVVDTPDTRGFAYGTLPGHPVSGEEAFIVRKAPDGRVTLTLRSLTAPAPTGMWRLLFPLLLIAQRVYRRRYQRALKATDRRGTGM